MRQFSKYFLIVVVLMESYIRKKKLHTKVEKKKENINKLINNVK